MIRLMRYLKPYLASIVLIVALLFLQANADLALPDYMSRIVNIGIQQGGVEDSVPAAIGGASLDKALIFAAPAEREAILAAYDRLEPGSEGAAALAKKYPKAGSEPLYRLKKIDAAARTNLEATLGKALASVYLVQQAAANPAAGAQMAQGMGMDLSRLPPGADLFSVLPMLPEAQRTGIVEAIRGKLGALDPMVVSQMGVKAVQAEYTRLGASADGLQTSYILKVGGLMLLLTLVSAAATILVGYLGARAAAGFARDLRANLFRTVEGFSLAELDKFSTASLITRSTNDITQMQMVTVMGLRMFFYAPIIGIGGVIRATGKASSMWWIIALAVAIILGVIAVVFAVALPRFKSIQKLIDRLNLVVRENLTGMMVIRAFDMQGHEEKRFDKANKDLTGTMLFVTRVMVVMMPLMMLIMNMVSLLVIWTGAHEVAQSQIRIGDMMAF
ncbi:ABC transporter ATP-binding protein, partial [bacterium]|nr:ABC transporter ATP-binding protein [bacterium]